MWHWGDYALNQAGCASALAGLWGGVGGFLVALKECRNGPL
jgi:hypothetical protein